MTGVASIVLFSDRLDETVSFYRTLGVPLTEEDHGDGLVHAAGEVGGVHMAVFAAEGSGRSPDWHAGGSTFVGFWVASLQATLQSLQAPVSSGARVLVAHQKMEWGCRAVVTDPDGRAVELNQQGHCAARSARTVPRRARAVPTPG